MQFPIAYDNMDYSYDVESPIHAKDMTPLSLRNEKRMIKKLMSIVSQLYEGYPQTYHEDIEILKRTDLTFN